MKNMKMPMKIKLWPPVYHKYEEMILFDYAYGDVQGT
jgi:hypothetical protein